jgi:nucleoside-diphosphate-sugar epimerase
LFTVGVKKSNVRNINYTHTVGGSGGVVNDWFFSVQVDADLELFGSGDKRWSWVHVDDLGEGYLRIAQAGSVVDHQVFNLGTLGTLRVRSDFYFSVS